MKATIAIKQISREEPITVTSKLDGMIVDCNHAGADYEELFFDDYYGDEKSRIYMQKQYNCDKCTAVSVDGHEWN